jgi:hypothetical protein
LPGIIEERPRFGLNEINLQTIEARIGLTLALPIDRYNSVKLYGSTDMYSKTGTEFDIVGMVWQLRWVEGFS